MSREKERGGWNREQEGGGEEEDSVEDEEKVEDKEGRGKEEEKDDVGVRHKFIAHANMPPVIYFI